MTITAATKNWTSGNGIITINDDDAYLTFSFNIPSGPWEGQTLANAGTVRMGGTRSVDTLISLYTSDATEMAVPPSVIVLAGQTTATFNLTFPADGIKDGTHRSKWR